MEDYGEAREESMTEKIMYFDKIKDIDKTIVSIWHARANQGTDTACKKLLARSIFRLKYFTTGFGIFGAEKGGAPGVWFNRISRLPIEDFHAPNRFDFIVIVDTTIDNVTNGSHKDTIYVVNTPKKPEEIAREMKLGPARILTVDATEIAGKIMPAGFQYPSIAMLGAVIHLFPEITLDLLRTEIRETESFIEKGEKVIAMNISAVEAGFAGTQEFDGRSTDIPKAEIVPPKPVMWYEYEPAAAITDTGNSCQKKTGDWRTQRPIRVDELIAEKIKAGIKKPRCVDCMLCFQFCPDFSIIVKDGKIYGIDLEHCKGCLICHNVCPYGAIGQQVEAKAKKTDAKK
jgi:2-oxoacid:acceptor oxidoreductase gamma subunit (pyruvate/2-ketoisovalerate family)/2-oxoacid:acceptor oxidoreductase delta subunit (pyruvate/2-ketoisovalerate family)